MVFVASHNVPFAGDEGLPAFARFETKLPLQPGILQPNFPGDFQKSQQNRWFPVFVWLQSPAGTVAKSLISPSVSSNSLSSLGISVIRLRAGLPPTCSWPTATAITSTKPQS